MSALEVVLELFCVAHALTSYVHILTCTVHEMAEVAATDTLHIKNLVSVGSIQCRYDKLVGMFSSKDVPAVGVSIGIERVFNLLEDKVMAGCKDESGVVCGKIRETDTEVTDPCLVHAACLLMTIECMVTS